MTLYDVEGDGESTTAEGQRSAVIDTVDALMGAEPEVAESFLLAALYVRAIRTEDSPRNVLDALFKALPPSEAWPALRSALLTALEERESET